MTPESQRAILAVALFAAAPGVDVEEDDLVETGGNATVQIEMHDGTLFKIGPDSRVLLAEYRLGPDRGVLAAGIEVLSGWLRFAVSKLQSADSRYDFRTPTMTIGIRDFREPRVASDLPGMLILPFLGRVTGYAINRRDWSGKS